MTSIGLTRLAEAVLAHLQKAGVSREDGVRAFATLLTYTVGFVSFELPRVVRPVPDRETSDLSVQRQLEAHAAARRFPHVQESVTELSRITDEQTFEFGLRAIDDALASRAGE